MKRICCRCKIEQPIENFYKDRQQKGGLSRRCKNCAAEMGRERHLKDKSNPTRWGEILSRRNRWRRDNLEKKLLQSSKDRAKKLGLDHDLELSDIIVPDVCPVLGIPIKRYYEGNLRNCPSIDRINNSKGYTKDNISVISHKANSLKSDATIEDLEKIIKYMREGVSSQKLG